MKKFVFYILIINILFDVISVFYLGKSSFSVFRGVFLSMWTVYILLNSRPIKLFNWIYLFVLYVLIQIPFSENILLSIFKSSKIFLSLLMLPVGFYLIDNHRKLIKLNNSIIWIMFILILNFAIANIFDIGLSTYTEDQEFLNANLNDSWNIFTYVLLLIPLIFHFKKSNTFNKTIAFIVFVILVLSMKRIAISSLFIGYAIYFFNEKKKTKYFKQIAIVLIIFGITLPLFVDVLINRFDFREEKLSDRGVENESRYRETIVVWEEALSFSDPLKSLFGLNAFYSVGQYGNRQTTFREGRVIHVDYNLMVNTIGIVGLFLYLNIYLNIFFFYRKLEKKIPKRLRSNIFKSIFYVLFLTSLITSFGGQMYQITFRSIIFLYLGAVLRQIYQSSKNPELLKQLKP